MSLRLGIEYLMRLIKEVVRSKLPILCVDLPTGYGKSTASFTLLKEIYSGDLETYAERVIHVVPTRCLVEEFVERARHLRLPAYGQCMYFTPELKDPYLLAPIIFSTIDSYSLNFFKVPVAEYEDIALGRSLGHFDIPRYAAFTALNIFDEYHLLAPGDVESQERGFFSKAWTTLSTIIYELLKVKAPVILETATSRPDAVEDLKVNFGIDRIYSLSYDASISKEVVEKSSKIVINDKEFTEKLLNRNYITTPHKVSDFPKEVSNLCFEVAGTCNVLITCNTIRRAIQVYRNLRNRGLTPILLHSQFTLHDRWLKLKTIGSALSKKNAIVVSTQVIEVGVNLDFDMLITDAAPIVSLVQRIGRVGRKIDRQSEESFDIHVLYDVTQEGNELYSNVYPLDLTRQTFEYIVKLRNEGKDILWRLSASKEVNRKIPYNKISESIFQRRTSYYNGEVGRILNVLLSPTTSSREATLYVQKLRSLVRDSIELPIYVPPEEVMPEDVIQLHIERLIPAKPHNLGLQFKERGFDYDLQRVKACLKTVNNSLLAVFEHERDETSRVIKISFNELSECFVKGYLRRKGERLIFRALIALESAYSSEEGFASWL
ncbi:MAG: CRISPR-associated helicase Cas3' [Candidatus Nezhaarchaeales archaeon]